MVSTMADGLIASTMSTPALAAAPTTGPFGLASRRNGISLGLGSFRIVGQS